MEFTSSERRKILTDCIQQKKEIISRYVQDISKEEYVYIDTNSQLKYWLEVAFSTAQISVSDTLDEKVKWIVKENPFTVCKKEMFKGTYELIRIVNECIEEEQLLYHYFAFWSNNNTIITDYKRMNDNTALVCSQIDFMITEKCSLKCRECLNLMQYYKEPLNYTLEHLKNEIDIISKTFDEVMELRVLGGEPFVNKDIYDICQYAIGKQNIRKVIIFTNATIVPNESEMEKISKDKCFFYLSNYGLKNQKIAQISSLLEERKYQYYVSDFSKNKWVKSSSFERINISKDEAKKYFVQCEGKKCPTVSAGKFYICEFLANATNLNAIPVSGCNYVELDMNNSALKEELKIYLMAERILPGCYYCHRLFPNLKEYVEPAIQCKEPLSYEMYEGRIQ